LHVDFIDKQIWKKFAFSLTQVLTTVNISNLFAEVNNATAVFQAGNKQKLVRANKLNQ